MSITPSDELISAEMKQLIDGELIRILSSKEPYVLRKPGEESVEYVLAQDKSGVRIPQGAVNEEAISEPVVPEVTEMLKQLGFNATEATTIIRRIGTSGPDRMQQMQW